MKVSVLIPPKSKGLKPGADPGFQVRGALKKIVVVFRVKNHDSTPKNLIFSIAEGGANIFGVFRVKNHDFTPKNHIFSNFRGGALPPWIRPCKPTYSTFQASRQLTMSINWPCYCTVHVYVVINIVILCQFFYAGFIFIVCLYLYCRSRSNYQEGMVGIPLTDLTSPHFCACPKSGPRF